MTDPNTPAQESAPTKARRPASWLTKAIAVFFALYAVYCIFTLFYRIAPLAIVGACVCASATFGLWRERPWVRYVVYPIAATMCLYFPWYVWVLRQRGWPYENGTFMAVFPAALLFAFGIAIAVHVARVFRER